MPRKLLLADDSVTIQKVVAIVFAHEDIQVTTVANGEDAIARARELLPDIVLADVVMPGKDGYEVCEALKADPATKEIPVLLLAGSFEPFDEDRARSVGFDGHLPKPFESTRLVEKVRTLIDGEGPRNEAIGAPALASAATSSAPTFGAAPAPAAQSGQQAPARTPAPPAAPPAVANLQPPPPAARPPASVILPPGGQRRPAMPPPAPFRSAGPAGAFPVAAGSAMPPAPPPRAPAAPPPPAMPQAPGATEQAPVATQEQPAAQSASAPDAESRQAATDLPWATSNDAFAREFAGLDGERHAPADPGAVSAEAADDEPLELDEEILVEVDADFDVEEEELEAAAANPLEITAVDRERPATAWDDASAGPAAASDAAAVKPAAPPAAAGAHDELPFDDFDMPLPPPRGEDVTGTALLGSPVDESLEAPAEEIPEAPATSAAAVLAETEAATSYLGALGDAGAGEQDAASKGAAAPQQAAAPAASQEEASRQAAPAAPALTADAKPADATPADGGEAALRAALSAASREVIEKIAWEVVPQLAEVIVREHVERLARERESGKQA